MYICRLYIIDSGCIFTCIYTFISVPSGKVRQMPSMKLGLWQKRQPWELSHFLLPLCRAGAGFMFSWFLQELTRCCGCISPTRHGPSIRLHRATWGWKVGSKYRPGWWELWWMIMAVEMFMRYDIWYHIIFDIWLHWWRMRKCSKVTGSHIKLVV